MRKIIFILCFFSFVFLFEGIGFAQDFVYTPRNPAFGGSYLNYSWMLSSATAQNDIEAPKKESASTEKDALKDFEKNLNRQILNQLSYQLVRQQIGGGEGMTEGKYQMGDYEINITNSLEGIKVSIYDSNTGSQTEVLVPNF
ncbi:MAG: curli production assembly/transport component CsgF [Bacteroidales bacterium]